MNNVVHRNPVRAAMVLLFFIASPGRLHSQSNSNTWFRLTGVYHFSGRLSSSIELQHRRQQGALHANPLTNDLLYSLRTWVNFTTTPHVTINVSPVAFYQLYPIRRNVSHSKPIQHETRISAGLTLHFPLQQRWAMGARLLEEFRNFSGSGSAVRSRVRFDVDRAFAKKFKATAQLEFLYTNNLHGANFTFDHSRAGIAISCTDHHHNSLELGYLHIIRKMSAGDGILGEHCVTVAATLSFRQK